MLTSFRKAQTQIAKHKMAALMAMFSRLSNVSFNQIRPLINRKTAASVISIPFLLIGTMMFLRLGSPLKQTPPHWTLGTAINEYISIQKQVNIIHTSSYLKSSTLHNTYACKSGHLWSISSQNTTSQLTVLISISRTKFHTPLSHSTFFYSFPAYVNLSNRPIITTTFYLISSHMYTAGEWMKPQYKTKTNKQKTHTNTDIWLNKQTKKLLHWKKWNTVYTYAAQNLTASQHRNLKNILAISSMYK